MTTGNLTEHFQEFTQGEYGFLRFATQEKMYNYVPVSSKVGSRRQTPHYVNESGPFREHAVARK